MLVPAVVVEMGLVTLIYTWRACKLGVAAGCIIRCSEHDTQDFRWCHHGCAVHYCYNLWLPRVFNPPLSWLSISTGQGAKLRDRIMTMLRKLRNEKHADCCFQARTQEFVGLTEILGGKYWSGDPYPTGVSSGTDRQILFQFCSWNVHFWLVMHCAEKNQIVNYVENFAAYIKCYMMKFIRHDRQYSTVHTIHKKYKRKSK